MRKLEFRESGQAIEVGEWWEMNDGVEIFHTYLIIKPAEEKVSTDCGDPYYDYSMGFDDFLAVANKIKELKGEEK